MESSRRSRRDPENNNEADGAFPTFKSSNSPSSSTSSDRTLPVSNRSKSIEPPAVSRSSLVPARSKSTEPVKRLNTRIITPSVRLPATHEEPLDSSDDDNEYNNESNALWTTFGHDETDRLPTISPPTLPLDTKQQQHRSVTPKNSEITLSPASTTATTESDDTTAEQQRRLQAVSKRALTDESLDRLFADEDKLLEFVAKINSVYEHTLLKDAPFMTFVLCGVQSAGKSYLVERFMNAVLNIVDDGTATRCPLDITCIHNAELEEPLCDLEGMELTMPGINLSVQDVFDRVTLHNRRLESEHRVSKKPLHLIYRSKHVQNMRFVDTPGTKMNQDSTRDDRKAIQDILMQEMRKPNAKLCILLQSTEEFATQPIVRFCDETFGSRGKWIGRAIFLMTKSDLLVVNKRSAADANKFFAKFHENHCYPHLIITPTLPHQGMQPDAMYRARRDLLKTADESEAASFDRWFADHDKYNAETGNTTVLNEEVKLRIGFPSAKKVMRNIMLEDTRKRLPEVLLELRGQIETLQRQWDSLDHRRKLRDPEQLKPLAMQALRQIEDRVSKYINGNLNACRNFPERMQTLGEEIQDESFSEWSSRKLNHHKEAHWRERIDLLNNQFPSFVQPNKAFLGGKQIQRAIEFFRAVMVDSLPDPQGEFRDLVANSVGYLANGTLRENWEQALVQIVETCVKEMTHPGINYVVKHVGYICRRLFRLAMDDIKQDDRFYDAFKVLPAAVEKHFMTKFDGMLWGLMQKSADRISMALEPMYSTIDPSISNFPSMSANMQSAEAARSSSDREESDSTITSGSRSVKDRIQSIKTLSADGVRNVVKKVAEARAVSKTSFLPEAKSSMITDDEADKILMKSFQYIVTLLEFNLVNLRFQMNHHLVLGFKETLRGPFVDEIVLNTNWDELIEHDYALDDQMKDVEDQIKGVQASLDEVKGLMN